MFPDQFVKNVVGAFGEKGSQWLQLLPKIIQDYSQKWDLYDLKPYSNLSYNYVFFGKKRDFSGGVVFKIGLPCNEFSREIIALKQYAGVGAVEVIEADPENGVILLQALQPGTTLKSFFPERDLDAVTIACDVIKKLHSTPLQKNIIFPSIKEWHRSLYEKHDNLPLALLEKARILSNQLIDSQDKTAVLLHADLHHENILLNKDDWVAIDPKGVVGESAYEVGAFIRNPIPDLMNQSNAIEITSRRLAQFSKELDFDQQRLKDWSFVQAVLSACWSDEENNTEWVGKWLHCAEVIVSS